MSRTEKMKKIRDEVISCKKCSLYTSRILPVIGQGDHQAKIVFIGEAPGANEDRTGYPFCGASGKILDGLLDSIGLDRKDVYICNLLKCRPPSNRDPETDEIISCSSYLRRQIKIINPKIVCSLGRYSMSFLMKEFGTEESGPISKVHGRVFKNKDIKFVPLYHPAVAAYNRNMLPVLEKDFLIIKSLLL